MANNRVYTESVVTLNNQEAIAQLDEIRRKALEVRREMIEIAQTKGINSKEFRAAQKELVSLVKSEKSLNEETKRFEKILKNLNGSTLNELQSALPKLQQQMRRTKPDTPEFKAYAEQLKAVRGRMRELEGQARNAQKVLGGFFSKIGWAGLVAGAISLIRKFGSDMIAQTQLVGDKWRFEVAGWKAAYGSFVADLSSGRGWSELVARMRDAYKNGKQVAAMLDEIFERNNSLSLTEGELTLEAEKQRKVMMDSTKSLQERIAAAEEYDRLQEEIAQNRREVAQEEMEAYKLQLQQRTEMTDAELDAFVKGYNANKDLIDQAKEYQIEYAEMQSRVDNLYKLMVSGQGNAYKAYKQQYLDAQAALAAFTEDADDTVVHWAGIIDKYNLGNDEMVKNYVQARKKMTDADVNYERATQRSNRQAATLRKQLATEAQQAQNKAYQNDIKASDERFKTLQNQAKQQYIGGEISETEYQNRLTAIQENSLRDRIAIGERHKQSVIDLQAQLLDLSVKQKQELEKIAANLDAALDKQIQESEADIQKEIDDYLGELSEDFNRQWSELLEKAQEISREINPMATLKTEMEEEMTSLQTLLDNGLVTEEDFQKKRLEIVRRYAEKQAELMTEPYVNGIQTAQKYVERVSAFTEALQEAASARLEAQMQAELTAAGDNAEKREAIEADYEQKKLDLQKRYANIEMGVEIAKAIAAGALASVQAWTAAAGNPVAAGVIIALIAATTAAQVATIISQRNAIMASSVAPTSSSSVSTGSRVPTGYSGGGFTEKRANDYQPVGVVHANEWVAPAAMVRANPLTFATLESMRLSGNYHSGQRGFADGGYTSPAPAAQRANDTGNMELLRGVYELLSELKAALPFPTYLVFSQASAKQEIAADIKKIVGK